MPEAPWPIVPWGEDSALRAEVELYPLLLSKLLSANRVRRVVDVFLGVGKLADVEDMPAVLATLRAGQMAAAMHFGVDGWVVQRSPLLVFRHRRMPAIAVLSIVCCTVMYALVFATSCLVVVRSALGCCVVEAQRR